MTHQTLAFVHISSQAGGETSEYPCVAPVTGRYLTVFLQDPGYLSLCEVEAYTGQLCSAIHTSTFSCQLQISKDQSDPKHSWCFVFFLQMKPLEKL